MPLTIQETCDKLNISKMTLYKYLHELYVKNDKYIKDTYIDRNHRRVLNQDLFNALKKRANGKHQRSKPNSKVYINKITTLQHDKKLMSKIINSQKSQINHQNKQLEQQQVLNLNTQNELKSVRSDLDKTKNRLITYKIKNHVSHTKHGFWWHLFH